MGAAVASKLLLLQQNIHVIRAILRVNLRLLWLNLVVVRYVIVVDVAALVAGLEFAVLCFCSRALHA